MNKIFFTFNLFIVLSLFYELNSQVQVSPRVGLNWQLLDYSYLNNKQEALKPITLAIGLVGRLPLNEKNYISLAFNAYPIESSYLVIPNSTKEEVVTSFNQVDFRLAWERKTGSKTLLGVGIELVQMFNVEQYIRKGPPFEIQLPGQRFIGVEFSFSHKIKRIEIFADAFTSIYKKENNTGFFNTHQKVQIGIGIPFGK